MKHTGTRVFEGVSPGIVSPPWSGVKGILCTRETLENCRLEQFAALFFVGVSMIEMLVKWSPEYRVWM